MNLRNIFAAFDTAMRVSAEATVASWQRISECSGVVPDGSSPDTSQPHFLDLIARIDGVTR